MTAPSKHDNSVHDSRPDPSACHDLTPPVTIHGLTPPVPPRGAIRPQILPTLYTTLSAGRRHGRSIGSTNAHTRRRGDRPLVAHLACRHVVRSGLAPVARIESRRQCRRRRRPRHLARGRDARLAHRGRRRLLLTDRRGQSRLCTQVGWSFAMPRGYRGSSGSSVDERRSALGSSRSARLKPQPASMACLIRAQRALEHAAHAEIFGRVREARLPHSRP